MTQGRASRHFFGDRESSGTEPQAAAAEAVTRTTSEGQVAAGDVPAGWYEDGDDGLRYWDGRGWTSQRVPGQDFEPAIKTVLWAMSLALGVAGVLGWGVPVLAFYWPLGLGGAGLAVAAATRGLRGKTPWYAIIALIAALVAVGIGIAGYSEIEDARNALDEFP
jgi:hypothetical protein